jgi:uncharacterized protein YfiM (DUF2279 family)
MKQNRFSNRAVAGDKQSRNRDMSIRRRTNSGLMSHLTRLWRGDSRLSNNIGIYVRPLRAFRQ